MRSEDSIYLTPLIPSPREGTPNQGRIFGAGGTERAGFEPAVHLAAHTRFPSVLLKPLGHLSLTYNFLVKGFKVSEIGNQVNLDSGRFDNDGPWRI